MSSLSLRKFWIQTSTTMNFERVSKDTVDFLFDFGLPGYTRLDGGVVEVGRKGETGRCFKGVDDKG